jgi:hypothetical protein
MTTYEDIQPRWEAIKKAIIELERDIIDMKSGARVNQVWRKKNSGDYYMVVGVAPAGYFWMQRYGPHGAERSRFKWTGARLKDCCDLVLADLPRIEEQ